LIPSLSSAAERTIDVVSQAKVLIGIHGATGRMGTRLIQLIAADPSLSLAAALARDGHPRLGEDAGTLVGAAPLGISLSPSVPSGTAVDVMIDFSTPEAAGAIADWCQGRGVPLLVGTTGFDPPRRQKLESASARIPILISPNTSRAVNLLMKLVGEAARAVGETADIEIIERHHRTKKDAPSGTALRLAEFAGRGVASARLVSGQPGQHDSRTQGEIAIHALRIADCPGEHTVVFGLMGETLELSHRALNRDGFVRGALDAARFLVGKPAGLYSMHDVLA
jgi:4-hydroxy-tetrahydrodipicolinate reductase